MNFLMIYFEIIKVYNILLVGYDEFILFMYS